MDGGDRGRKILGAFRAYRGRDSEWAVGVDQTVRGRLERSRERCPSHDGFPASRGGGVAAERGIPAEAGERRGRGGACGRGGDGEFFEIAAGRPGAGGTFTA